MNKYTIYFELYGKKMKTTVDARNEKQAKKIVVDKIIFHKIVLCEDSDLDDENEDILDNPFTIDPQVKNLMDILGINNNKNTKKGKGNY